MTIKENKPLLVNLIYMAVLIITFIYKYAIKDYDELFRIGLAAVTAWIVYFVCKITFLKKSEICFYVILAFTFSSIYLGNVWDLYRIIPIYDKLLHLLSGVIIAVIGLVLFLYLNNGKIKGDFNTYLLDLSLKIANIVRLMIFEVTLREFLLLCRIFLIDRNLKILKSLNYDLRILVLFSRNNCIRDGISNT